MLHDFRPLRLLSSLPSPDLYERLDGVDDDGSEADHGRDVGRLVLPLDQEVDGRAEVEQGEQGADDGLDDQKPSCVLDGVNDVEQKDDSWEEKKSIFAPAISFIIVRSFGSLTWVFHFQFKGYLARELV